MLGVLALVVTQLGTPPPAPPAAGAPTPPALTVAVERTSVDVVAFSDDGTFALARERTFAGHSFAVTFLLIGREGVTHRLPVSSRVRGILADALEREVCVQSAEYLASIAKDLRGVTVRIGLCSASARDVVDVMTRPRPAVLSKKIAAFHQQVGFAGRVFLPPTGPLVIVIGVDELGNDRIGVATRDR